MSPEYNRATEALSQALKEEMWARCLHEAAEQRVLDARKRVTDLFAIEMGGVSNNQGDQS